MTINDLPENDKQGLLKLLKEDILRSYHSGKLGEELGEEIEEELTDEEVLMRYNNESCWSQPLIEEYLLRWKAEHKK